MAKSFQKYSNVKSDKHARSMKLGVRLALCENIQKIFNITDVTRETTIEQFKKVCELVSGIPVSLQRLHYLDEGRCMFY